MAYERTILHKKIQIHSIPLFNRATQEIGTGLFVVYNDINLVISAYHVFANADFDDILLNLGINGQKYPMKKLDFWSDPDLDLCCFRLDKFEATIFTNLAQPFSFTGLTKTVLGPNHRVAICGFPSKFVSFDKSKNSYLAEQLLITSILVHPSQWPTKITNKVPEKHFMIKHGFEDSYVLDENNMLVNPVPPFGLSGAGVWLYDSTSENDDQPKYSLFGIQSSFYPEYDLLCGVFIDPAINHIKELYV